MKLKDGGAYALFYGDYFGIKNAPFDVYVEYRISEDSAINVTSIQNITIAGEPAVKIYGDGMYNFNGIKTVEYLLWHDKEPYVLEYMANVKDFEKYLPQFEQIVKTFKFVK
jgi:hypothetical protein